MSYQQAYATDCQDAVILKFSAATTQSAADAAPQNNAQSTYAVGDEPMIFSLVDYLPASKSSSMPPLFQIEMIEAQYSQFMEESAVHVDSSSRLWEEVKPGGIRAM